MIEEFHLNLSDDKIGLQHIRSTSHPIGTSLVDKDEKYCFITIPKNSSSTMKYILKDWQNKNFKELSKPIEHIVILRDPTARWISAVSEFLAGSCGLLDGSPMSVDYKELLSSPLIKKWIFNNVYLDTHCLPQCYFLQGLSLANTKFFNHDLNAVEEICELFGIDQSLSGLKINQSGDSKKYISNWLREQLSHDPELQHIIDVHYWCDHQLLDTLQKNS